MVNLRVNQEELMITDKTMEIAMLITFVQMANAKLLSELAFDEPLPKSGRANQKLYFKR